jgi:hypothetical protein
MKRTFIAAAMLVTYITASAQKTDSTAYKQQRIAKTDIQLLLSFYTQDGEHSAVTGGIGTEALHVYATDLSITHQRDSANTFQLELGIDAITSASTDKIDFVMSSASREDNRVHINTGYTRHFNKHHVSAGINAGVSVESDYLSIPIGVSFAKESADMNRRFTAAVQCYFDDLRWGRLNPDYYSPEKLIYPEELRYKEWFDIYRRTSYNVSLAYYQVMNQRMQLAVFPELVYQDGLLSTPFHRVYFNNDTLRVENLPRHRWKIPLGVQLNVFTGSQVIIRSYYRYYKDNFGIGSHTFQVETPVKLSPLFTLSPLVRLYTQTASRYFRPYRGHTMDERFYTSDYDLSRFTSYKAGLGVRYTPFRQLSHHYAFREIGLRYAFYKRTNQLSAHMISLLVDLSHSKG